MKHFLLTILLSATGVALRGCAHQSTSTSIQPSTQPNSSDHVYARPIDRAISDGVAYLVNTQQPDGSWGTGTVSAGNEVYASVPGSHDAFRVAVTALAVMALREAGETSAHDRGVEYLVTSGYARRQTGDLLYNTWTHTYALQALAGEMRAGNHDPRTLEMARWHLDRLQRYETYIGGWNYYDFNAQTTQPSMGPTSFGTAAGLVALEEARDAGIEIPQKMIDRCRRRLEDMRLPDGAYLYSYDLHYRPGMPANRPKGSVGRTQACNYALWLAGSTKVTEATCRRELEDFFANHGFIEMGRKKPWPHESWYQTSGYYFYFGHSYTAKLIERLGGETKSSDVSRLAELILPLQEPDGSWWDYAMWDYHKPYGTAFAVMTLLRCR